MTQSQQKNKSKKLPKLIVVLGPTASGKSELALKLAKKFNGEIVSADSRQIYREMDIGTNKIQKTKIKNQKYKLKIKNRQIQKLYYGKIDGIPHYMIDIVNPDQEFTLAEYKDKALKVIDNIVKRKKIPFLVGGTGLYIQAVIDNLEIPRVPPNKILRKKLEKELKEKGLDFLWKKLILLDPKADDIVQKENPRRVIRALEVCVVSGKPFSSQLKKGKPQFNVLQIGIKIPRKKLYKKIDERVDQMIKQGLINETKKLTKKYSLNLPSMSGIGYKEISDYLLQKQALGKAIQKIKYRTHRYARSQESWFRRDRRIKWIKNYREAERLMKKFLINQ